MLSMMLFELFSLAIKNYSIMFLYCIFPRHTFCQIKRKATQNAIVPILYKKRLKSKYLLCIILLNHGKAVP